jgi:two-component system, sensor histidine kinase and response regulator
MTSNTTKKDLILIVDDQPNNLKVISSVLSNKYTLSFANSGERALKILEKINPGLILLDIMMPDMDGYEVCEKIKMNERTKDIPIIFLSAKNEIEDIIKGFDLGAVDYISKPFNIKEINVRIQNHLNLSNARKIISDQKTELETYIEQLSETKTELEISNNELTKTIKEKDKFFSIIAHDLKTPFNGLLGLLQILNEDYNSISRKNKEEMIASLYQSTKNVYALIENLLEWSRTQGKSKSFSPKEINPYLILTEIINIFEVKAKLKEITLINDIDKNLVIFADEMMINAIFRNLISNALKYSRKGGKIKTSSTFNNPGFIAFSVEDNGIGMTPETISQLFQIDDHLSIPGTENEKGTGLGLILCKEFVELHKGIIEVKSEVDKGSVFKFNVPYFEKTITNPNLNNTTETLNKKLKVLIVEDEIISEEFLSIISFDISSEILKANDGIEAVEMCKNNADIDLIMMDIKMPLMDGYEATRKIREFNKNVIIIAQTAYTLENDRNKALQAGCNDYISKPILKEALMLAIHKYFN